MGIVGETERSEGADRHAPLPKDTIRALKRHSSPPLTLPPPIEHKLLFYFPRGTNMTLSIRYIKLLNTATNIIIKHHYEDQLNMVSKKIIEEM